MHRHKKEALSGSRHLPLRTIIDIFGGIVKTEPTTQQKIAGLDKEIARRKNELRFLYIFAPILPIGGIGVLGMYVQISPDRSASSFANSIALWVCISGLTCILLTIPLSFMRRDLLERRSLFLESLKHQNEYRYPT